LHHKDNKLKKIISISLIFLVNFFFLAHEVLPHHHHEGIPHFFFEIENHDKVLDCSPCCCDEGNASEDSCALDQDVDVLAANDEDDCGCSSCFLSHPYSSLYYYAALTLLDLDFSLSDTVDTSQQSIYLLTYQSICAGQGFGLRAPPFSSKK